MAASPIVAARDCRKKTSVEEACPDLLRIDVLHDGGVGCKPDPTPRPSTSIAIEQLRITGTDIQAHQQE